MNRWFEPVTLIAFCIAILLYAVALKMDRMIHAQEKANVQFEKFFSQQEQQRGRRE